MKISIRLLGSTVAAGLMCVAIGGAATSAFVLKALTEFNARWSEFTQGMEGENIDALSSTVSLMHFLVLGGSIATISTLFIVGAFFMWFTNRKVVKPMVTLTATMDQLADGNTDINVPYIGAGDEIGVMAHAVGTMKENAIARITLERQQKEMEERNKALRQEEMQKLAQVFESKMVEISKTVADASNQIKAIANMLSGSVHATKDKSSNVSTAANETSANMKQISESVDRLSSSLQEVNQSVSTTATAAQSCAREAQESRERVDGLHSAVEEIDSVIKEINDIAEQTNLLALNATIEAARAGEAGKGFSVVASEVKNLANQTQGMTEEINTKVTTIKQITEMFINSINQIIERIENVDVQTANVARTVDQQNVATSEINENIRRSVSGTQNVSDGITGISEIADQSVAIAKRLDETSSLLLSGSQSLEKALHDFLHEMNA